MELYRKSAMLTRQKHIAIASVAAASLMGASFIIVTIALYRLHERSQLAWHAEALRQGQVDVGYDLLGVPRHLVILIEGGSEAAPYLIELLECKRSTPFVYHDRVEWAPTYAYKDQRVYRATVADLADYGLRAIYGEDVGFASKFSENEQKGAIERWKNIVRLKGKVRGPKQTELP